MNVSTPQSDTPQGWDRYSQLLHRLDKRSLPDGFQERFQQRLSGASVRVWRFARTHEFLGGASLAVLAAVLLFAINGIMPSSPAPALTVSAAAPKANAKHQRIIRRPAIHRLVPAPPSFTAPTYVDTMPPSTLDQDYQDPAVTGQTGPSEDQMQHDAQPGVPAMTR